MPNPTRVATRWLRLAAARWTQSRKNPYQWERPASPRHTAVLRFTPDNPGLYENADGSWDVSISPGPLLDWTPAGPSGTNALNKHRAAQREADSIIEEMTWDQ